MSYPKRKILTEGDSKSCYDKIIVVKKESNRRKLYKEELHNSYSPEISSG
jgi:hypothetical protein